MTPHGSLTPRMENSSRPGEVFKFAIKKVIQFRYTLVGYIQYLVFFNATSISYVSFHLMFTLSK